MTAADSFARDAIKAALLAHVKTVAWVVLALVTALSLWCGGKANGRQQEATKQYQQRNAAIRHVIDSLTAKYRADSIASAQRERDMERQHVRYADLRKPVHVLDDTTLVVDRPDTTLTLTVPKEIPALIRSADTVVIVDSLAFKAKVAELDDMRASRDAEKQRADNAEAELKARRPPRFGLKAGLALGASAVGLLVYLIK